MRSRFSYIVLIILAVVLAPACSHSTSPQIAAPASESEYNANPVLFARHVPERGDDFAWENDLVAFRAYGPALRASGENAGTDCWLKRVSYPIIDKWYDLALNKGLSYHEDHGEGLDNYHVGASLGCGGTVVFIDGQYHSLEAYTRWSDLNVGAETLTFKLHYAEEINGDQYEETKQVTLMPAVRLFRVESTFSVNSKPAPNLPVAVGLTTHNGWQWQKARSAHEFNLEQRWASVWESLDGLGLGTGVVLAARHPAEALVTKIFPDQESEHVLLATKADRNGKLEYFAGYGWEGAGDISTHAAWQTYLNAFVKTQPYSP